MKQNVCSLALHGAARPGLEPSFFLAASQSLEKPDEAPANYRVEPALASTRAQTAETH